MISATVNRLSSAFDCGQYATPLSRFKMLTEPEVGANSPDNIEKIVDFPAPFAPSKPKH